MSQTEPRGAHVSITIAMRNDPKEAEFVRNYIVDRSETYELNPVERALCRQWLKDELNNVFVPMIGGVALALIIQPKAPKLSMAIKLGSTCWPVLALSQGGVSRPSIEFPANNPLFVECITACEKKFPQSQIVRKSKWMHDSQFMSNSIVEYPIGQSNPSNNSLDNSQLAVKNPVPAEFLEPFRFWIKLRSSKLARQIWSADAQSDQKALIRATNFKLKAAATSMDHQRTATMDHQRAATMDHQRPDKTESTVSITHPKTESIKSTLTHHKSAAQPAPPVEEPEEPYVPVSQWPDLHPDVNIDALERLAASRHHAERERRALKRARELLPDSVGRTELAQ